jgi:hypothetical protein
VGEVQGALPSLKASLIDARDQIRLGGYCMDYVRVVLPFLLSGVTDDGK